LLDSLLSLISSTLEDEFPGIIPPAKSTKQFLLYHHFISVSTDRIGIGLRETKRKTQDLRKGLGPLTGRFLYPILYPNRKFHKKGPSETLKTLDFTGRDDWI
jgi:hypothetical protein